MTRFSITVEPHSSLFVGGYTHALGDSDGDTATDVRGMLIPGSAMKGALRESATRLVNAVGRGDDILIRLFGDDKIEGLIRVGPLHAGSNGIGTSPTLTLRHHVTLERATRQASPGRLFSNRVTAARHGLSFRGELLTSRELEADELGLLRSAIEITDQIGGGRGRGLGMVSTRLAEFEKAPAPVRLDLPSGRSTIILVLEADEPLQLGAVKDPSNVSATKGYLDGSAVRGAVAATLRHLGAETLEMVFGGDAPAAFGDGHPGHLTSVPAPMTLREPKAGGAAIDDAARLCAGDGRRRFDTRAAKGTFAWGGRGWIKVTLKQRIVTRTARDHRVGRAAEGQLFSLEVIDPVLKLPGVAEAESLRFYVPVTGTAEQLHKVVEGASSGLVVGSTRSRGFGRLHLHGIEQGTGLPRLEERHERWAGRVEALGSVSGATTGVLLALGPLAVDQARLMTTLEAHGLKLIDGVSRRHAHGGWNGAAGLPRTISSHFLPGSTFIVKTSGGASALEPLGKLERDGIGPGRPDGWGRLVACHPIHVDCKED